MEQKNKNIACQIFNLSNLTEVKSNRNQSTAN